MTHGELYATCEKGIECREEAKLELTTKLKSQWRAMIENFIVEVNSNVTSTEDKIDAAYLDFILCAEDNECCAIDEKVVRNAWLEKTGHQERIHRLNLDIHELNIRLEEIANECPTEYAALEL